MLRYNMSWIVFCALWLAGCQVVYSERPLGEQPVVLNPEEWEGTWLHEQGAVTIAVLDRKTGSLELGWVEKKKGRLVYESYQARLMQSGEWLFGNMQDPEKPGRYLWARLKKDSRQLIVWNPDAAKARALVRRGILPGKIDDKGEDVILGELGAAHLRAIVTGRKADILDWENPVVFIRFAR